MARTIIENCHRLGIQRDLFRSGLVKFDGTTHGTWRGLRWTVSLGAERSILVIGHRQWELVPSVSRSSAVPRVRWYVRGSDGKMGNYVLLTPDGRLGTRTELSGVGGIRYLSQRLWSEDRQRARQRQKVYRKLGLDFSLDWCDVHPDFTPKKPRRVHQSTYRRHLRRLDQHR